MTNNSILAKRARKIKSLMALSGLRQRTLAGDLKVTDGAIHRVIHGGLVSARIRREIAIRLGTTPEKLWPVRRRAK